MKICWQGPSLEIILVNFVKKSKVYQCEGRGANNLSRRSIKLAHGVLREHEAYELAPLEFQIETMLISSGYQVLLVKFQL